MKKFCQSLREHVKKVKAFLKVKAVMVNKRKIKSYQDAKVCYFCRKESEKSSQKV